MDRGYLQGKHTVDTGTNPACFYQIFIENQVNCKDLTLYMDRGYLQDKHTVQVQVQIDTGTNPACFYQILIENQVFLNSVDTAHGKGLFAG